jgi:2-dehydrotetronate isomerase
MLRFSANLGFLWTDRPLADAIRAAAAAGFDAVECHWPYDQDPAAVCAALVETGLPMLGLNTIKGPRDGDFGLAALPDRRDAARAAIDQAFDYGAAIGAGSVHVMAGNARGVAGAAATFEENLNYACDRAAERSMAVLIEPLNARDVPGYFLIGTGQAAAIVERVGRPELGIMFDCYHAQISHGDLLCCFEAHRDKIRHLQIAAVPSRAEPDEGEIAYGWLLPAFEAAGYAGFVGAEYRPRANTDSGLSWLRELRGRRPRSGNAP